MFYSIFSFLSNLIWSMCVGWKMWGSCRR